MIRDEQTRVTVVGGAPTFNVRGVVIALPHAATLGTERVIVSQRRRSALTDTKASRAVELARCVL